MFPTDPDLFKSRTRTTDSTDARNLEPTAPVLERDRECVLTGTGGEWCRTSHLIPHVKGDTYIHNLTTAHDGAEVISDIDSLRNVILVNGSIHVAFGKAAGIMKKPNFAYPGTEDSWVFHVLDTSAFPPSSSIHGKPVTVPADRTNWPQSLLFDHAYASAIIRTFGQAIGPRDALKRLCRAYYESSEGLQQGDEIAEFQSQARDVRAASRVARNDKDGDTHALRMHTTEIE